MTPAAEGWYVDPSTGTNLRWWSGSTWTDEVAPLPPDRPRPGQFTADAVDPAEAEYPALDNDIEHTQLTRRELRERRGTDPNLNDAPKHLPLIALPPVVVAAATDAPIELEVVPIETVAPLAPEPSVTDTTDSSRRLRIVRLSILLGILAVVSSVGLVTTGMF